MCTASATFVKHDLVTDCAVQLQVLPSEMNKLNAIRVYVYVTLQCSC